VFLLVIAVNDAAFYMKTPLFAGVFHTSREGFMTRKERKPASNMVAWISSQTLNTVTTFAMRVKAWCLHSSGK
jgi:hypothetical protein